MKKTTTSSTLTIPKKAYEQFTQTERKQFPIIGLGWKHEGSAGPVWVIFKVKEEDENVTRNYRNADIQKADGTGAYAEWFTYSSAKKLAKALGVEFNEF